MIPVCAEFRSTCSLSKPRRGGWGLWTDVQTGSVFERLIIFHDVSKVGNFCLYSLEEHDKSRICALLIGMCFRASLRLNESQCRPGSASSAVCGLGKNLPRLWDSGSSSVT